MLARQLLPVLATEELEHAAAELAQRMAPEEQLELLRQFGAQQVQGYLVSQPLPLAELMSFMNAERQAAGLTH